LFLTTYHIIARSPERAKLAWLDLIGYCGFLELNAFASGAVCHLVREYWRCEASFGEMLER
jgi:hypothetical protein